MRCTLDSSIPDWLIEYPKSAAIFEELGLDTHCGGKSLEYLCEQSGLDAEAVLIRLKEALCIPAPS